MDARIKTTEFYADLKNGTRTPVEVDTAAPEAPTNPLPPEGGEIGDVTGAGTVTNGAAPALSRASHQGDIFVTRGSTMNVTYTATRKCTLLPMGGFEDMRVLYSADGRSMTLEWDCPANEPGSSLYVGCSAWIYGGDNVEAYSEIWDRLHVGNKNAGDLVYGGKGTAYPVLQDAVDALLNRAGLTLILTDGEYNHDRDHICIGASTEYQSASPAVNGSYSNQTIGGKLTRIVDLYTNVMAQTPCGIVLNRGQRPNGVQLIGTRGTYGGINGYRETIAIVASGFVVRGCSNASLINARTEKCFLTFCMYLNNLTRGQGGFNGDGAAMAILGVADSGVEYIDGIGNSRLLNSCAGSGFDEQGRASDVTLRKVLTTPGCIQNYYEDITQSFTRYGSNFVKHSNTLVIDSDLFYKGTLKNGARGPTEMNWDYIATNSTNKSCHYYGIGSFNSPRNFYHGDGVIDGKDVIENSVCFAHIVGDENTNADSHISFADSSRLELNGVTLGKNLRYSFGYSVVREFGHGAIEITSLAVVSSNWDLAETDTVFAGGPGTYSVKEKLSIANAPAALNQSVVSSFEDYERFPNAQAAGFKYWWRLEEGSAAAIANAGCANYFITKGRYGSSYRDEASNTLFDGLEGRPYVNWLSRSPWKRWQKHRQWWACTSNSQTFTGNRGWAVDGINPIQYMLREGTTPSQPINTPYIEELYARLSGADVVVSWVPICVAYRQTVTGYSVYVDNTLVLEQLPKAATEAQLVGIDAGTRKINIVVHDSEYGDSGLSRSVYIVVP